MSSSMESQVQFENIALPLLLRYAHWRKKICKEITENIFFSMNVYTLWRLLIASMYKMSHTNYGNQTANKHICVFTHNNHLKPQFNL